MAIDFKDIMKNKEAYLEVEEVDKMFQWCYDNDKIRDYLLILVLANTGRRIGEIVGKKPFNRCTGLRPVDLICKLEKEYRLKFCILKKNHVHTKTKDGKPRNLESVERERLKKKKYTMLFPIDEYTYTLLKAYIQDNHIGALERIFRISQQRAGTIVRKIATKCKIVKEGTTIHPHIFRHTFAIHFLKKNQGNSMALNMLQQLLVHSKLDITTTYLQFSDKDKRIAMKRMAFGGKQ